MLLDRRSISSTIGMIGESIIAESVIGEIGESVVRSLSARNIHKDPASPPLTDVHCVHLLKVC